MTAHRDELGIVCTHGQLERVCPLCELTAERDALAARVTACTTHFNACRCREAEFAAKDKRIAELKIRIRQYERWCEDAEPRLDALAELVSEVVNGHYDMRSEFVAAPDWLARARAAIGEGR